MDKESFEMGLKDLDLGEGFSLQVFDNGYFEFISNDLNVFRSLGGGYNGRFRTVKGIGADLFFHELEHRLSAKPLCLNSSNRPVSMTLPNHKSLMGYSLEEGVVGLFPISLNTASDLVQLKLKVEQFWKEEAKPFFEYWSDIRSFLPFLESSNISLWVQVLGKQAIESKMIIWKLCNHSGYQSFVDARKAILEDALEKQPENKRYLEVLESLVSMEKLLSSVDSLYEWDDSYLTPKPFKGVVPQIP